MGPSKTPENNSNPAKAQQAVWIAQKISQPAQFAVFEEEDQKNQLPSDIEYDKDEEKDDKGGESNGGDSNNEEEVVQV